MMLVDLARNDLSRNAHDVQVDFYKEVQYYSHVIHLVSRVSGEINTDSDPVKTYVDTFPAGTLSGAPKVRAMQLITDIEHHNRGAYGGCIGFIGLDGDLNQAITNIFYTKYNMEMTNTGQQQMPGMKAMMYMMPLMFLVFFNQYASGLTYYYFISTLITIVQTLIFRYTINEDKLLAKLEANKRKPMKKSSFMKRLEEAQRAQQETLRKQQEAKKKR